MPSARVLKQVRINRHFELADVAHSTGINLARLQAFEEGTKEPTFRQIETLANTYGLPSYLLGTDNLPNLPTAPTDFRKARPSPANISPAGMQRIWNAENTSQVTKHFLEATSFARPKWATTLKLGRASVRDATELRSYFDSWYRERSRALAFSGTSDQRYVSCFRIFLEAQGLIVRINDAPEADYFGFYLLPEGGLPVTFINRKILSPKAQLFTMLHEFAHHIIGQAGISNPFSLRNDIERQCNQFAAAFLAPEMDFRRLIESQSKSVLSDVFKLVDAASYGTKLSKHAAAIRLRETGFIDQNQLKAWLSVRAQKETRLLKNEDLEEPEESNRFAPPHARRVGELGHLPVYAAKCAFDAKLVNGVDIAATLSLSQALQEKAFSLAARRIEAAAD